MKYLQVKLDDTTKEKFRKKCANEKVGMSEIVKKWINDFLKGV